MLIHRNHYWKIWIFWKYDNNIILILAQKKGLRYLLDPDMIFFKLKITLYAYSPSNVNCILLSS